MFAWLRPRQWRLFALAEDAFLSPPSVTTAPLSLSPDVTLLLHGDVDTLLLWLLPGSSHPEKIWAIHPPSGQTLWLLPRSCGRPFHLHFEPRCPWIMTAEKGVFLLSQKDPLKIFAGRLAPHTRARLPPSGHIGFLNDSHHSLVAFSPDAKMLWSRDPKNGLLWQAPFPTFDSQGVCLSNGSSVQRLDLDGDPLWIWPPPSLHKDGERFSIERLISPDLLLVRISSPHAPPRHVTLDAKTGSLLHELGSVWAFGADGRSLPPTALLEGDTDLLAFLLPDGSRTPAAPLRRSWLRSFLSLPPRASLLLYDRWLRFLAGLGPHGRILWQERVPDAESGFFAHHVAPPHLFLFSPEHRLHTLTFPSSSSPS